MSYRYIPKFATISSESRTVPFDGLTMRQIYDRFVRTGQRPVENPAASASEDDPYNPEQDIYDRAALAATRVVSDSDSLDSAPAESSSEVVE